MSFVREELAKRSSNKYTGNRNVFLFELLDDKIIPNGIEVFRSPVPGSMPPITRYTRPHNQKKQSIH